MKTALEMYQYCIDNKLGSGFNRKWGEKHFGIIESNLQPNEKVLITFIGIHNYVSATKHENHCAYAITDRRLIVAQKKLIGEYLKIVLLNTLNDVTYNSGLLMGTLVFDTIKEKFNVFVDKNQANNILQKINETIFTVKNDNERKEISRTPTSEVDEIKIFKQLLDEGTITQAEFDAKKKQILNT